MLPAERKNEILTQLMLNGKVVVSDLALQYRVTEETIRRDLEKLEQEGLATKIYGGAVKNDSLNVDLPYTVRKQTNVESKKFIAEQIGNLIHDGDRILLDASTTALYTVKHIYHKSNITLITNSVEILLDVPPKNDWNVICTGGRFAPSSLSFVGQQAEEIIDRYHVDLAVLSCKGIDRTKGLTDTNDQNASVKKAFLGNAKRVILGVDSSKFDKISFVRIGSFAGVDTVVTEKEPDAEWKRFFAEQGIRLLCGAPSEDAGEQTKG
jgi:DeoR/GlpR family transcriptional regulator of sugar metabolism